MDKFKMELTWHNCKTCPPKEEFNPWLLVTDGHNVDHYPYYKKYGFNINEDVLHKYWWADLCQTVHETKEFKGDVNDLKVYFPRW